jgi:anti-sigma factor RsiW
MSALPGGVDEHELNALVDGRLSSERAAAIDGYLAAHPEEQVRLQQYIEQQRELRLAFAAQADRPIPIRLRAARLLAEQRRRRHWRFAAAAAAVVFLILGGIGGWTARDWSTGLLSSTQTAQAGAERAITTDALAAHQVFSVEVRHPVEVDAAQEAHLVQWLSKRLGRPLVVPDLRSVGFQLMGGRLLPSEGGPAAQFMYQNDNNRLTLYERADSAGETRFRYNEENGIGEFYWSDQDFGYALIAKVDRKQLLKIAEIVYHQLSGEGAKTKTSPASPPPPPGKAS